MACCWLAKRSWQVGHLALLATLSLALVLAAAPRVRAQGSVDLQLVLAVDVSGSVSEARFELQKRGYVAAFRDPRLLRAIQSGSRQRIAVTVLQWTGPVLQVQVVPWRFISTEASMHALADAIEAVPRQLFGGGTAELKTVSGGKLWAMMNGPRNITVKDEAGAIADISTYDVLQSNGVIHVVDRVLMPR